MKKFLLLLIFIVSSFICSAQLEVKEGSFKEVTGFVNINTEKMTDDNDQPYAVLKVRTENIDAKQRQELSFKGDARTFFAIEHKDGEVWVYLSYYASYIKISHPDLSSTEFRFPFEMDPKKGYELTLVNKKTVDEEKIISLIDERLGNSSDNAKEYGFIIIKTTPVDGATVYIDGKEMEMKTPFVSDKIEAGPHKIKIVNSSYQDYITVIKLDKDEIKNLEIKLVRNQSKKTDVATKKQHSTSIREKGWVFRPEIGYGHFEIHIQNGPTIQLSATGGYQINSFIYCGLGIGYEYNYNNNIIPIIDYYNSTAHHTIPLYLNSRFYFNNRKYSIFFDISLGYKIQLNDFYYAIDKYEYIQYNRDYMTGLSLAGGIGIEYKHSNISINGNYLKGTTICYDEKWGDGQSAEPAIFLILKYGYSIYNIHPFKFLKR